ncbi:MAG: aldehyde dehydrogenase family protein [Alphaproteobacteria bacterium]|nr:aldehyde dehydrogenase family protein [Alphaproteobacteria bacterium]
MFNRVAEIVKRLNLDLEFISSGNCVDYSPVTGEQIASFPLNGAADIRTIINRSKQAFEEWRQVEPNGRSNLLRLFGDELRAKKEELAELVVIETGKIYATALKEVERSIEICDMVADMQYRMSGFSVPTQGRHLAVSEVWQPIGPVVVITSFNFPLRVWVLNALLALVCGNPVIWRPSRKATLTAFAVNSLLRRAKARSTANCPEYLSQIVICNHEDSVVMAESPDVPLLCATGSPVMARGLQSKVGQRLGRSILSVGGNNAVIVTPSADLNLAKEQVLQSAIADAGQRCTSLHRLFCHSSVYDEFVGQLKMAFNTVYVNSPFERQSQIGPLIDKEAFDIMRLQLEQAKLEGGIVSGGNRIDVGLYKDAYYVQPAVVEMPKQTGTVKTELLAPVLYVMRYDDLKEAVFEINEFSQTLLAGIFSNDLKEIGYFCSMDGVQSDAAIVNAGMVGYDMAAMFTTGKDCRSFATDVWRPFMQSKTCLTNYNF